MANSATLTFGYTNTEFTRKYKFDNLSQADCEGIKAKVKALNASVEAGTAGGLSTFFVSDDFNAAEGVGYFNGIVGAQYESPTITTLF